MRECGNGSGPEKKVLIADEAAVGQRLDAYLAQNMPDHVSRSRVKALIKSGQVTLNGADFLEPNYRIKLGETIALEIPEPEDPTPKPEDIPLSVLFEDDQIIIIDKPVGMVVHPAVGNWSGTLVNALLYHCGDSLSGIGGVRRPGIVHRLDKDTSGVMVVAKTELAHASLSTQFADHGKNGPLVRSYRALVWGKPPRQKGTIDRHLGRSANNRLKQAVVKPERADARHAVTHYEVIHYYGLDGGGDALASLVDCRLETGRTHQIRVHMAEIGNPLIGDQTYGLAFQSKTAKLPDAAQRTVRKLNRQALHAFKLGIEHPVTGEHMEFTSPVPSDLQCVLDSLSA